MDERDSRSIVERFLAEPNASTVSNEALRQRERRFRAAFPDLSVRVERILAAGDLVAVHLQGRGTHLGVFQGCPATGLEWNAACTAIYRVEAGRIAEAWSTWDLHSVFEQLGCVQRVETVSA